MLKRIHVHNFRTFLNFERNLPAVSVLVGRKGSGKSSLLDVLGLLQDVVVHGESYEPARFHDSRTRWLEHGTQSMELLVTTQREEFQFTIAFEEVGGKVTAQEELRGNGQILYRSKDGQVSLHGDDASHQARAAFPFDRRRSFLSVIEERNDNTRIIDFRKALASVWLDSNRSRVRPGNSEPSSSSETRSTKSAGPSSRMVRDF